MSDPQQQGFQKKGKNPFFLMHFNSFDSNLNDEPR